LVALAFTELSVSIYGRGKLEDKEILCFRLNFPGKFRRQKHMHGVMRVNQNHGINAPINVNPEGGGVGQRVGI
jgi:hypothetical protein